MVTSTFKRIVCLANSRMPGGTCIAGKELLAGGRFGRWIRPVSGREGEGVAIDESCYVNGAAPRLFDIVDVPVLVARPEGHQRENWLLALNRRWKRAGQVRLSELPNLADSPDTLWVNGQSSSTGLNDRVHIRNAASLAGSLYLIKADLTLNVSSPGAEHGDFTRRVRGHLRYGGTEYLLRVTDPDYEREYFKRPNGSYPVGEPYVTVSLGGAFYGYCYKLIAAIIES